MAIRGGSKYPGNPLWCQDHDHPYEILSPGDWDDAIAAGHLTPEHVVARLRNIAEYELGNGAELGLSADGFYNALVADGVMRVGDVTLRMWPNDHPPPHLHLEVRGDPKLHLRMRIDSGELLDDPPEGWSKKLKTMRALVAENASSLMEMWTTMQASSPPSA